MEKQDVPRAPGIAAPPPGTPTERPDGRGFIGGKSKEFNQGRSPITEEIKKNLEKKSEEKEEKPEADAVKCRVCGDDLKVGANFCSTCGLEIGRKNLHKALGIEISEEDVSHYFFQGYLTKEVELARGKKALFKTLVPSESKAIDDSLTEEFKNKTIMQQSWDNAMSMHSLSHGWIKFDGQSLGKDPASRYEYLNNNVGGHLIDIAAKKWSMFNRIVSAMLEDPDAVKN